MVVQAGEVGGGPAGGPALRVGDPYGPAAAQGVAELILVLAGGILYTLSGLVYGARRPTRPPLSAKLS